MVHRVDGPRGVDVGIRDRQLLGRAVVDLDPLARWLEEAAGAEDASEERGGFDRDDAGAGLGGEHAAGAHPGADVEDSLVRVDVEPADHFSVHR